MRLPLLLWCACSCACSGTSIGSIGDHRVEVATVAGALHAATELDPIAAVDLILTDDPAFPCENVAHVRPAAARSLALRLFSLDGGVAVAPTAAGTYVLAHPVGDPLPDGQYGFALYVESDPLCRIFAGNAIEAHDGTVTLTQVSPVPGGAVAGRFDLTLLSTDHLAGSFATRLCGQADGGPCR